VVIGRYGCWAFLSIGTVFFIDLLNVCNYELVCVLMNGLIDWLIDLSRQWVNALNRRCIMSDIESTLTSTSTSGIIDAFYVNCAYMVVIIYLLTYLLVLIYRTGRRVRRIWLIFDLFTPWRQGNSTRSVGVSDFRQFWFGRLAAAPASGRRVTDGCHCGTTSKSSFTPRARQDRGAIRLWRVRQSVSGRRCRRWHPAAIIDVR